MRSVIVYLFVATLAELLVKIYRRDSNTDNAWIYRRLWNDTVFDCWSLRVPTWSGACQKDTSGLSSREHVGFSTPPRPGNKRRSNRQSTSFFSKPRVIRIRSAFGLLGWLPALMGEARKEDRLPRKPLVYTASQEKSVWDRQLFEKDVAKKLSISR